MSVAERTSEGWVGSLALPSQWAVLIALSVAIVVLLAVLGVPATLMLGPMFAGIAVTTGGGRVRVPAAPFALAQGLVGCMIARTLPMSIAGDVLGRWPLFALGVLSVIAASGALGWLAIRLRVLPGTAVLWGLSPGGAAPMTVMAELYGADTQLVAFMQYLRVVMIAAIASVLSRLWGVGAFHPTGTTGWAAAVDWLALAETLALASLGPALARALRFPAGSMLLPFALGVVLTHIGWMRIELPPWLLAAGYALVGWRIGLRFTRKLLVHVAKALPRIVVCTSALIGVCAAMGALIAALAGIDPLTAFLATSPGGANSMAIIAASSNVDASFVMAMQTVRLIVVLVLGPATARFIADRSAAPPDL